MYLLKLLLSKLSLLAQTNCPIDSQLFIADLHLDPAKPGLQDLALRFLHFAQGHSHLYILGDLFEYWLGDDIGVTAYSPFINQLAKLPTHGCSVTVMLGNRDFLLGDAFAAAANVHLVKDDELKVQLGSSYALLMHGDTLCTDDTDYQKFRQLVRDTQWQDNFVNQPVDERIQQAQAMRDASKDASASKRSEIMDVNAAAVSTQINSSQCPVLIHGHTHRPAIHNVTECNARRYVVGDWHEDHAQFVQWTPNGIELLEFR